MLRIEARTRRTVLASLCVLVLVLVGACASSNEGDTGGRPAITTAGTTPETTRTTTTTTTTPAPTTTSLPPPLPPLSPAIASPGDNRIFVVGDSVILGAQIDVPRALDGWIVTLDANESRLINHGLGVLRARQSLHESLVALAQVDLEQAYLDAGLTPPKPPPPPTLADVFGRVFVLHLCTNYLSGGGFDAFIDQYMSYLKDAERVVWVTCGVWSDGQTEANHLIKAAAAKYPKIVVADWASFAITPGYTYEDGIHLTDEGRVAIAQLVARAVGPAPTPLPPPTTTTRPTPTSTTTTSTRTVLTEPEPVL